MWMNMSEFFLVVEIPGDPISLYVNAQCIVNAVDFKKTSNHLFFT